MTTVRANATAAVQTVTETGFKDAKGRAIGVRARIWEVDFVECNEGWGGRMPVGHYFAADVMATRDGERYGASQSDRFFSTAADRDAFVATRIAGSIKAAAKKAA